MTNIASNLVSNAVAPVSNISSNAIAAASSAVTETLVESAITKSITPVQRNIMIVGITTAAGFSIAMGYHFWTKHKIAKVEKTVTFKGPIAAKNIYIAVGGMDKVSKEEKKTAKQGLKDIQSIADDKTDIVAQRMIAEDKRIGDIFPVNRFDGADTVIDPIDYPEWFEVMSLYFAKVAMGIPAVISYNTVGDRAIVTVKTYTKAMA